MPLHYPSRSLPWLEGFLSRLLTSTEIEIRWADLRGLRSTPKTLSERLRVATQLFPCRILFVHRDAEKQDPELRYQEIQAANTTGLDHICIVPVRMQETWLLHNEAALREAADRPSGTEPLNLPPPSQWERLPDPKETLHQALRNANGASGRRARRFNPAKATHRLAQLITDWSPIRPLLAFQRLEADVRVALESLGALESIGE